jgi:hypothetical protein
MGIMFFQPNELSNAHPEPPMPLAASLNRCAGVQNPA